MLNLKLKKKTNPTFISLSNIDTSLQNIPSGNSIICESEHRDINEIELNDINENDKMLDKMVVDHNDLFHVIDFNAEQLQSQHLNHHQINSSSFLGNKSPSLGSMIFNYSEVDKDKEKDKDQDQSPAKPAKHITSSSTSMVSMNMISIQRERERERDRKQSMGSIHRRKSTNNLNNLQLQSFPTLKVPNNSRKIGIGRKRSSSSSNGNISRQLTCRSLLFSYLLSPEGKILHHVYLPPTLPPSKILLNNDNLRDRMIELYDKYIGNDSIHELNLPFTLRNRMNIIFNAEKAKNDSEKTMDEYLYNIMDEVACSILRLMRDSFNRFKYIPKNNNNHKKVITKIKY